MSDSTSAGDSGASIHRPVLVREVLQFLDLGPGLVVVDGTVGGGGHSKLILEQLGPDGKLIGLDRDPAMLVRASHTLSDSRAILRHGSYAELPEILDSLGISRVDRVLLDLGLSSDQLADASRGFGIQTNCVRSFVDARRG
jgi:16S rRNA (cytosine1402-N4)-methyltransferase